MQTLSDYELIERYIEQDPRVPLERTARLRDYGVSVWALVAYWQGAGGDIDRTASAYDLPREAVEAALAYYRHHRLAIDVQISEHLAAFD